MNGDRQRAVSEWVPLVAVTLALFGFHLWISSRIGGPSVVYDEAGYLGNARLLAGGATWEMPRSPIYASGYSLVLAPVMATFGTADAQWRGVLAVNAALLASLFPLLRLVGRRVLGLDGRTASVAAVLGSLAPAVLAAGVSAIAENLVLPLVALSVLACWAMIGRDHAHTGAWPYGYGLTVGALLGTHPRFTVVVPIAAVALLVGARRGIIAPRVAVGNGIGLVLMTGSATMLNQVVASTRWDAVSSPQGGPSDWVDLVGSPSGLGELALSATGQLWYLAAGSLGLAIVGIIGAVRIVRGRSPEVGGAPRGLDGAGSDIAGRFALGVLLASMAGVFATSVAFFAQNQIRPDHWVYGRHNDSFTPLLIVLAVAALVPLVRAGSRRRQLGSLAFALAVVTIGGLAVAIGRDPSTLGVGFSPFAVPAITRAVNIDSDSAFWVATGMGQLGILAIAIALLVARSTRRLGPRQASSVALLGAIGLGGWFIWSGLAVAEGTDDYEAIIAKAWTAPEDLTRLGVTELQIEGDTAKSHPMLTYPWHLPQVDVTTFEADQGEQPDEAFVLARLDDPARLANGDRVALLDEGGFYSFWDSPLGLALWVQPGPEQDRLERAGRLLPVGFPAPLPTSARQAEFAIEDPPETLDVRSGASLELEVAGRHTGSGAPWPDAASFGQAGHVRVIAEVSPLDPAHPRGVRSGGKLDAWTMPGDPFRSSVEVFALDEQLTPLPPGRYRVHLGIGQYGQDWFAPTDVSFTMQVTGAP